MNYVILLQYASELASLFFKIINTDYLSSLIMQFELQNIHIKNLSDYSGKSHLDILS